MTDDCDEELGLTSGEADTASAGIIVVGHIVCIACNVDGEAGSVILTRRQRDNICEWYAIEEAKDVEDVMREKRKERSR